MTLTYEGKPVRVVPDDTPETLATPVVSHETASRETQPQLTRIGETQGVDGPSGGACWDCRLPYTDPGFADLVVPHNIWAKVSPTGHEGGLLCPTCLVRRAEMAGVQSVAEFRSGPFALMNDGPVLDARALAAERDAAYRDVARLQSERDAADARAMRYDRMVEQLVRVAEAARRAHDRGWLDPDGPTGELIAALDALPPGMLDQSR